MRRRRKKKEVFMLLFVVQEKYVVLLVVDKQEIYNMDNDNVFVTNEEDIHDDKYVYMLIVKVYLIY
jgi:hypothetical protein